MTDLDPHYAALLTYPVEDSEGLPIEPEDRVHDVRVFGPLSVEETRGCVMGMLRYSEALPDDIYSGDGTHVVKPFVATAEVWRGMSEMQPQRVAWPDVVSCIDERQATERAQRGAKGGPDA